VAPVYEIPELTRDPQLRSRGAFSEARHPEEGVFEQVAPALAGMNRSAEPVVVRAASASDTEALLRDAGVPDAEIDAMRADGVIA
jgi:alpha-methylacyl-CoA racemase